jgi:hypothetical protein
MTDVLPEEIEGTHLTDLLKSLPIALFDSLEFKDGKVPSPLPNKRNSSKT